MKRMMNLPVTSASRLAPSPALIHTTFLIVLRGKLTEEKKIGTAICNQHPVLWENCMLRSLHTSLGYFRCSKNATSEETCMTHASYLSLVWSHARSDATRDPSICTFLFWRILYAHKCLLAGIKFWKIIQGIDFNTICQEKPRISLNFPGTMAIFSSCPS